MTIKESYRQELTFLEHTLNRCKDKLNTEGIIQYSGFGYDRKKNINPAITLYKTLLPTYLTLLKEYQEMK